MTTDISNDQIQNIHTMINRLKIEAVDRPELHFIVVGIIRAIDSGIDHDLIQGMIDVGFENGHKLKGEA